MRARYCRDNLSPYTDSSVVFNVHMSFRCRKRLQTHSTQSQVMLQIRQTDATEMQLHQGQLSGLYFLTSSAPARYTSFDAHKPQDASHILQRCKEPNSARLKRRLHIFTNTGLITSEVIDFISFTAFICCSA